jgi:hypothetical protein
VQERGVLMADYLAADPRLLEDVHGLQQQGRRDAELADQRGEVRRAREALEGQIEVVEGMADLVDRGGLALPEPALAVERLLLEEEPDLVARLQEVAVLGMAAPGGREHGRGLARLERRGQLGHARRRVSHASAGTKPGRTR